MARYGSDLLEVQLNLRFFPKEIDRDEMTGYLIVVKIYSHIYLGILIIFIANYVYVVPET